MTDYTLEELVDGQWQEEAGGSEIGSLAMKLAMQRIIIPGGEFAQAARDLPLHRPLTASRRLALQPRDIPQLTPEQKKEQNERVKEAMIRQRRASTERDRGSEQYGGGDK
jgi:hypothetical protein